MADEIKILNNVNLYATPTDNIHITTKGYVDTGLSGKADSDHTHTYLKGNGNTTGKFWTPFKSWNTYLVSQSLLFPEFSTTASYSVGDYITLEGVVYKCSTAHSGTWNANHFTSKSVKGYVDDVASGKADIDHDHHVLKTLNNKTISLEGSPSIDTYLVIQDRFVGGFNSNSSYVVGSVVSYVGNFWKCTTAHSGAWDGSHFTKITLKNYIDDVASGKANATHTHSGSDITSGTVGTSYLPAADGTNAGIISVAANSGLVASNGALSVNVTDGSGLSKNATTGAIAMRTASSSAYGTVRIASSVASDSSYVVPSSLLYSTLQNYVPTSDLTTTGGSGQNGKVVQLNSNGLIDTTMVPKIAVTDTFTASSESGMTSLSNAEQGDICIRTDLSKTYILTNNTPGTASNWKELATPADTVTSVNTKTGAVTLTASDVGASATGHTHDRLRNGNGSALLESLPKGTYLMVQERIVTKRFEPTESYAVGDYVAYTGKVYKCTTSHSGDWNDAHFSLMTFEDAVDEKDANLRATLLTENIAETYSSSKTYNYGDICSYNGQIYIWANGASGSNHLPIDTDYWSEAVVMDSVDIKMTEHTHSSLKSGSYTVSAPAVSSASYVVAQESIVPLYSNTTSYSTGNICSYNGKIYRYKYSTSSSTKLPTNTTYWEETTVKAYVDTGLSGKANSSHSHTASDLPTATTSAKGIVQIGSGLSVSNGVVSVSPSAVSGIMGMGVYTKLANLSTPTVTLADDTALYNYTIAGNTTLVFDSSNLTMTTGTAITFELYLVMPATVYTVTFPNTVSWLNNETPSMSTKSKTYMLTFRSINGGATWLGSKEGCY